MNTTNGQNWRVRRSLRACSDDMYSVYHSKLYVLYTTCSYYHWWYTQKPLGRTTGDMRWYSWRSIPVGGRPGYTSCLCRRRLWLSPPWCHSSGSGVYQTQWICGCVSLLSCVPLIQNGSCIDPHLLWGVGMCLEMREMVCVCTCVCIWVCVHVNADAHNIIHTANCTLTSSDFTKSCVILWE